MTCREFFEFLMAYLDDELPAEQRAFFESHLAACPPCVAYLDTYQEAVQLGRQACCGEGDPPPADVPEELVQAILSVRRGPLSS